MNTHTHAGVNGKKELNFSDNDNFPWLQRCWCAAGCHVSIPKCTWMEEKNALEIQYVQFWLCCIAHAAWFSCRVGLFTNNFWQFLYVCTCVYRALIWNSWNFTMWSVEEKCIMIEAIFRMRTGSTKTGSRTRRRRGEKTTSKKRL